MYVMFLYKVILLIPIREYDGDPVDTGNIIITTILLMCQRLRGTFGVHAVSVLLHRVGHIIYTRVCI